MPSISLSPAISYMEICFSKQFPLRRDLHYLKLNETEILTALRNSKFVLFLPNVGSKLVFSTWYSQVASS